jgi:hypothetical protein
MTTPSSPKPAASNAPSWLNASAITPEKSPPALAERLVSSANCLPLAVSHTRTAISAYPLEASSFPSALNAMVWAGEVCPVCKTSSGFSGSDGEALVCA